MSPLRRRRVTGGATFGGVLCPHVGGVAGIKLIIPEAALRCSIRRWSFRTKHTSVYKSSGNAYKSAKEATAQLSESRRQCHDFYDFYLNK